MPQRDGISVESQFGKSLGVPAERYLNLFDTDPMGRKLLRFIFPTKMPSRWDVFNCADWEAFINETLPSRPARQPYSTFKLLIMKSLLAFCLFILVAVGSNFGQSTNTDTIPLIFTICANTESGKPISGLKMDLSIVNFGQQPINIVPLPAPEHKGCYTIDLTNYAILPDAQVNIHTKLDSPFLRDYVMDKLDKEAISQHILGVVPIVDPHRYIAADVNGNGSITQFDVIAYSIADRLQTINTTQSRWRLIPKTFNLDPNPGNPFGSPTPAERLRFNGFPLNGTGLVFEVVGVLIGDANGDGR